MIRRLIHHLTNRTRHQPVRFIYVETITLSADNTDRREELEAHGWEEHDMDQHLPLDDRLGRVQYIRYTPLREDT